MRTLIIGHTGQDGRILWDQLIAQGHSLVGISRSGTRYHSVTAEQNVKVTDIGEVRSFIGDFQPHQVYYLAACHHSSEDKFIDKFDVHSESWRTHVYAFEAVLESLRLLVPKAKVFYASSSRIFGTSPACPQNEATPWAPACIYGTTKASGMLVAGYYRRVHAMHISCGILYNHESSIRGGQFVSQRIVQGLVAVKKGKSKSLEIGSLDARVDWGYAPDYTRAMILMLERDQPSDLVVATGHSRSVREFVASAAAVLNLNWQDIVVEKTRILQRNSQELRGDASRLCAETGWEPQVSFDQMVEIMVDSALSDGC